MSVSPQKSPKRSWKETNKTFEHERYGHVRGATKSEHVWPLAKDLIEFLKLAVPRNNGILRELVKGQYDLGCRLRKRTFIRT